METMTTSMQQAVLTRAGYLAPSVNLGIRCVQGDLPATRGQVRPMTGAVAGLPVRIRPFASLFEGHALPGGPRYTT